MIKERILKLCDIYHTNLNALTDVFGPKTIGHIRNYFSGNQKTLSLDDIILVADYFGVSIDYLVGRTDDIEQNYELKVKELIEGSYEKYLYSRVPSDGPLNAELFRAKPMALWPYNLIEIAEIPVSIPANNSIKVNLEEVVDTKLAKSESICIRLYFEQYMTLDEIGKKFGVTRERIRQILAKACRKLKHPSYYKYILCGLDYDQKLEEEFQNQMKFVRKKRFEWEQEQGGTIRDLGFSVRTCNCLKRHGIETVNELLATDIDELLSIRNFGKRCLDEVLRKFPQMAKEEVMV